MSNGIARITRIEILLFFLDFLFCLAISLVLYVMIVGSPHCILIQKTTSDNQKRKPGTTVIYL